MQVFKAFLKIGYSRIPSVIMYLVIFGALSLLMASFFSKSQMSTFETSSLNVAVIDEDKTKTSQALEEYLAQYHHMVSLENKDSVLLDQLYYRQADYILRIPKGFEASLSKGDLRDILESIQIPGSYNSAFVDQQIQSYLSTLKVYLKGGCTLDEALDLTADNFQEHAKDVQVLDGGKMNNESGSVATYYFQFLPYILLSMLISGLTPILTTFRSFDLDARIRCSALSTSSRNLQLIAGCIFYSVFNWILLLLLGMPLYLKYITPQRMVFSTMNALLLLLVCVAITLLISSFAPKDNLLSMISNVVSLGMSFLCGIFVPQYLLGNNVLSLARFLPFYWYVRNNNMINQVDNEPFVLATYGKNSLVLLVFALAIFALTLVSMKYQSEKK